MGQAVIQEFAQKVQGFIRASEEAYSGSYPSVGQREQLFGTFLLVGRSHLAAISILFTAGLPESAFALIRPLVDTVGRGCWLYFEANDKQIEKFLRGTLKFPEMGALLRALEERHQTEGNLFASLHEEWSIMCGYTHSGLEQIGRWINPERIIQPNYSVADIQQAIRFAVYVWMLNVIPYLYEAGRHNELGALIELHHKFFGKPGK